MKTIGVELPIAVNNFYACTVPSVGKPYKPEINERIGRTLLLVREELLKIR